MIFYFSATGNSRYVAQKLSAACGGDRLLSIPELLRAGSTEFSAGPGERVGFVVPTYFWGLPAIVEEFLRRMSLTVPSDAYFYFVVTYGSTPGAICPFAERQLGRRGFALSSCCSVRMPDTWTPIFDLSDAEKVAKRNAAAEPQIRKACSVVSNRAVGNFVDWEMPLFLARAFARPMYGLARGTSHFSVSDKCIGCGLCARQCPDGAIEMRGGKPAWVKPKCDACLGCLHLCPKFAISRGHNTRRHGQYRNPHDGLE
jgi:ferredoxin